MGGRCYYPPCITQPRTPRSFLLLSSISSLTYYPLLEVLNAYPCPSRRVEGRCTRSAGEGLGADEAGAPGRLLPPREPPLHVRRLQLGAGVPRLGASGRRGTGHVLG